MNNECLEKYYNSVYSEKVDPYINYVDLYEKHSQFVIGLNYGIILLLPSKQIKKVLYSQV